MPPNRLTADHIVPWKITGREDTPLAVLCNSCNGRKQHRGVDRKTIEAEVAPKSSATIYVPSGTC